MCHKSLDKQGRSRSMKQSDQCLPVCFSDKCIKPTKWSDAQLLVEREKQFKCLEELKRLTNVACSVYYN